MANAKHVSITTPVGRIVAGDLFEPRTTDQQGNKLTTKTGPKAGQPTQKYFIALAIPKGDAAFNEIWALMSQTAQTGFPHLFNNGACVRPDFAWKYTDGDSTIPNRNNVRPCDKEGYPGHHIINMESTIAPKIFDRSNAPIPSDSKAVKRGDYVRVYISIAPNDNAQNPGLYVNPVMVQFSHAGEEIFSGPDAASVFGANPMPAAPAGAVTTPQPALAAMPTGTTAPNPIGQTHAPNPVASATVPATSMAMPPSAPAAAVPTNVQPAPDFLNPPTPTAPVVERFSVQGAIYTRDQLRGFGWTDEQINTQQRA